MRGKIQKKMYMLLALALLLMPLAACGDGDKDNVNGDIQGSSIGEEIKDIAAADNIFSLNSDQSGTFNPYTDTSVLNRLFMPLIYEPLFEVDGNFNVNPKLIKSFSSEDGKCWLFYVDTSVKFQDGSGLTAQDAAYSLTRALRSGEYSGRLSNVYGVSAMDNELFMVNLYDANRQFPALLNIPVVKSGSINETAPIGTGPYKYNENHTELNLWEGYSKASDMPINTIYLKEYVGPEDTISAFEDSLIDLVQNDPTGLSELGYGSANEKRYCNTTNFHYIGFNQKSAFFCYPKFRYFVTFAVNREQIVTELMGGSATGCTMPISPLSPLYNQSYGQGFDYNMEKAATSLKNAGAEDLDADGKLEFSMGGATVDIKPIFLVCGDTASKVAAARNIVENLQKLGIEVDLRELSWDDYKKALDEGEYDMYYAEIKLSADFNIMKILKEDGSLNYGKISDPGYEKCINEYLGSGDEDRKMYADLMCKYILDTAPIVPICFEKTEVLTHRGVVSGAAPTQYNIFNAIESWTINLG